MKIIQLTILFLFAGFFANAQVKDVSVTFSPIGEYSFWDNKAGLKDGFLIGGKVGFGFGEFIELSGTYLQSNNLKTNFEKFGLANYDKDLFSSKDVTLTRWGGEFKANIGTHGLKPYVTLGSGIQSIEIANNDKFEQIYASLGLGVKLNLSKRVVFLVEGKNTMYNFNSAAQLLTSADKTAFGVTDADFSSNRLSNWAIQGALQFYLGGRTPETLSELDQAYLNQFRGGLRGIQLIIEPGAAYVAFDNNSLFRDTWFVGGYAGLDFNKYIGIRGFYFQAIESMKLSTDFENLSMYGMEFRARLNASPGITPYISLGGGYLNPENSYGGKGGIVVKGNEFASGGLGLNIPLGKRVLISGGARAMITSAEKAEDIQVPGNLQTNIMYNAGIKISLGRNSKSTDVIYQENLSKDVDSRMAKNDEKIKLMKQEYQNNIDALEVELRKATDEKDVDKAVDLIKEKEKAQKALNEVERLGKIHQETLVGKDSVTQGKRLVEIQKTAPKETPNKIQMSPADLESLVVNILKATRQEAGLETAPKAATLPENSNDLQQQIDLLNQRLDFSEKLLTEIHSQKGSGVQIINPKTEMQEDTGKNAELKTQTITVTPPVKANVDKHITFPDEKEKIVSKEKITTSDKSLLYKNSAAMVALNVGGTTTTNLGVRLFYDIINLPLEFMPEIYIGAGSTTSFGFSGNIIYPFTINSDKIIPYVGLGLGLARIDREFRGNYNVILGTQLPFISKNLSVDYTMRNSFNYNQLAIIYKFPF